MAVDSRRLDANGLDHYFKEVGLLYDQKYVSKSEKRVINVYLNGNTLIIQFSDGTSQEVNVKYNEGSADEFGLTKVYSSEGNNTDGTMTQKAITTSITNTRNDLTSLITQKTSSARYGVCSTAAATVDKVVTSSGEFILEAGSRVTVKFTYANTANSPTLNVNNTGAKYIYANGHQLTANSNLIVANGIYDFIYDGTNWEMPNITNIPKEAGIIDFYVG